jgi:hypothetical protein
LPGRLSVREVVAEEASARLRALITKSLGKQAG